MDLYIHDDSLAISPIFVWLYIRCSDDVVHTYYANLSNVATYNHLNLYYHLKSHSVGGGRKKVFFKLLTGDVCKRGSKLLGDGNPNLEAGFPTGNPEIAR